MWWPNTRENGTEFSAEEIITQSAPVLHKGGKDCGIYFLILDDEIVYVGQSVDVKRRLDEHSIDPTHAERNFNRYYFILCKPEELDRLEAYYILKFRPRFNIAYPKK